MKKIIALITIIAITVCMMPMTSYAASVKSISTYSQLKSALTSSGGSYKLTKDISGISGTINVTKGTHKLNLNGHSITGNNTNSPLILVKGGTLTITGSVSGSLISNKNDQDAVGIEKGTLNIKSGTLKGKNYAVYQGGGTLNISGGSLKGKACGLKIFAGTANISGGKITGTDDVSYGISAGGGSKKTILNISGGSINGATALQTFGTNNDIVIDGGEFNGEVWGLDAFGGGNLTVNGGTFTANEGISLSPMDARLYFTMTGGEAVATHEDNAAISMQNMADVTITGGTFTNTADSTRLMWVYGTFDGKLDIADGVIDKECITDNTPSGLGLIATSFTQNDTKYQVGMTVQNADDMYSAVMDALYNLETEISFNLSEDLNAVLDFYILKWTDGITKEINSNSEFNDGVGSITISVTYKLDHQIMRLSKDSSLESKVSATAIKYNTQMDGILKKCIKSGMTTKEKAKAIHDYMIKNYSYDYSYKAASYEFYGPLKNKKGVCQGFATLYAILLNKAGINCETVSGFAVSAPGKMDYEGHMWNVITLKSGNQYYVDVTYDEGFSSSGSICTKFFYKSQKTFYGYKYHFA